MNVTNGFFSFKWTMRVIALVQLFMLAIMNLVGIFYIRLSWNRLSAVASRPSDKGLIHLNILAASSLGTISRNPHSMCVSLLVFSISWVPLQVGSPTSSPLLFHD